ncbi:MAG TPA: flavodoxin domain-containing protein [Acidimicrobiia bacterium]|nr:flavodoxin domain-containing protein [Acidimicrobiia bacterium]
MKSVVVYESVYGNTAAVAEAIASGLRAHGDVDLRAVGDEPAVADLLVVGAPTHGHGLPTTTSRKEIVAAVEEAEGKGTPLDYNRPLACAHSSTAFPRSRPGGRPASTLGSIWPGC